MQKNGVLYDTLSRLWHKTKLKNENDKNKKHLKITPGSFKMTSKITPGSHLGPIGAECENWAPQKPTSLAPWGTPGGLRRPILKTHSPPGPLRGLPERPLEPPKNQSGPPGDPKAS